MNERDIKHVYGETIFDRGRNYFNEVRVLNVVKFRNKLFGEVIGTEKYRTEVELDNLQCDCSCPYHLNCKHGVSILLQYLSGNYADGDEAMECMETASRDDLKAIIERLVLANPIELMPHLLPMRQKGDADGRLVMELDKQIKTMLKGTEHYYIDTGFAYDLARFIKTNEDTLTKDQIFHIMEFLVEKCEDYGYFYDGYTDSTFGDEVFENLCDAFARKSLEEGDFERLKELESGDDYGMLVPFFDRMMGEENAARLRNFGSWVERFIDERSFIEFLINAGKTGEARGLIERSGTLGEKTRFNLYLRIDRDEAVRFAEKNRFYPSLIEYYHRIGEHGTVIDLFEEMVREKTEMGMLSDDLYLYEDVFDSIGRLKTLEVSRRTRVLEELFSICYSLESYDLCVDIGICLEDKELLSRLLEKREDYNIHVEFRITLLDYLKYDMGEAVERETKELAEALIEQKDNYAYAKAVECSFVLREIMDDIAWREYIKELYSRHSRKINLWREFKEKGVAAKKIKGVVQLELRL